MNRGENKMVEAMGKIESEMKEIATALMCMDGTIADLRRKLSPVLNDIPTEATDMIKASPRSASKILGSLEDFRTKISYFNARLNTMIEECEL